MSGKIGATKKAMDAIYTMSSPDFFTPRPLGRPGARQSSTGQIFIPCPPRRKADDYAWSNVLDLGVEPRQNALHPHLITAFQKISACSKGGASHVQKKISAGLILVRTPQQTRDAVDSCGGRQEYQAIVVKGRITYAFGEFVQGNYDEHDIATVRQLITHMTVEERLTIYGLDFDEMWNRISVQNIRPAFSWRAGGPSAFDRLCIQMHGWNRGQGTDFQYAKRREKFRHAWMSSEEATKRLRSMLISASGAGESRWEFPKGKRLSSKESDVHCAIREFCEETGIPSSAFVVVPDFARVDMYMHMGVLYVSVYYLAILTRTIPHPESQISLRNSDQVPEVVNVTWMGADMLRRVNGPVGRDLSILGVQAFRVAKNYIRGTPLRPMPCQAPVNDRRTKKKKRNGKQSGCEIILPHHRTESCGSERSTSSNGSTSAPIRKPKGAAAATGNGTSEACAKSPSAVEDDGGGEWQVVTKKNSKRNGRH